MSEGLGWGLNIDDKVFSRMTELENKLKSIATQSEATKNTFIAAFRDMGEQGVGALISKLTEAQNKLTSLSNIKITGGVGNLGTEAAKSVDDVNKLVSALDQLKQKSSKNSFDSKQSFNSDMLKASIKEYGELSQKIVETSAKIDVLAQKTRAYELEKQRISQGKSGMISPEMTKNYEKNMAELNTLRESVAQWEKSRQNVNALNQELAKQIQLLAGLKNYEQNRTSLPEQRKNQELKEMNAYYKNLERTTAKLAETNKQLKSNTLAAYTRAMQASENTILQRTNKLRALQNVERQLSQLQQKYPNILARIKSEMARLTNENTKYAEETKKIKAAQEQVASSSSSLMKKLALMFSVSSVMNYVRQISKVRGEFELQQKSLQVLLRDKNAADKLWQQTVDLAVRSPFRVKELVTYTRQLAAYRIESDKLFDTTKRLADVSAGLGVDMQRLILAYGQVKAANFLRGTELRQFTEAGIPMLDELAKRFTKLEGRAVSVGEVFSRISKRMVSFRDVAAVFEDMTNKGGTFYQMQEEQSKTLAGMISNLKDSIDLMLNDIGRANDGILKSSISLVREFVENWRLVSVVLQEVAIAMAFMQVAKFIAGWQSVALLGTRLEKTLTGVALSAARLRKALQALQLLIVSNPWIAAAAAVAAVGYTTYRYAENVDALNERYTELQKKEQGRIDDLNNLNERVKENNKAIIESKKSGSVNTDAIKDNAKALEELKTKYPNIADDVKQHTNGIVEMTKAYEEQNEQLRANILLQEQAKGGLFQDDLKTNYSDLLKAKGDLDTAIEKTKNKAYETRTNLTAAQTEDNKQQIEEISKLLKNIENAKDVTGLLRAEQELADYRREVIGVSSSLGFMLKDVAQAFDNRVYYAYNQDLLRFQANLKNSATTYERHINKIYENNPNNLQKAQKEINEWVNAQFEALGIVDEEVKKTSIAWLNQNIIIPVKIGFINKKNKGYTKDDLKEEWQKELYAAVEDINQSASEFKIHIPIETFVEKDVNSVIKELEGYINSFNAAKKGIEGLEPNQEQYRYSKEQINQLDTATKLYEVLKNLIAYQEKSKDKGKDSEHKTLKNRISLIKEINKEYEKLNNTFDATTAKEKVLESFGDTFKQAFAETGISLSSMVVDTDALNDLKNTGKLAGKTLSESMIKEIEQLKEAGTYIRNFDEDFLLSIKHLEGFRAKAYKDAGGVWTQGYGETINIEQGEVWDEEKAAMVLRDSLTKRYVSQLNEVLDDNKELVLTQKQYNALLDLTYQGGKGAVISILERTKDISKGVDYINLIASKIKETMGAKEAERFGEAFVNKFKEAESVYERIAMLLEVSNLTIKNNINKGWYQGMQQRSDKRASMFRGDLEVSKTLQEVLVSISDIDFTNIEGVIHQLKQLAPLAKKEGKEAELVLSKAISELEVQVGIKKKSRKDKKLIDDIEKMFSDYKVSLELKELNIPPTIAKQLFDVDYIDLSALKNKIQGELDKVKLTRGQEKLVEDLEKQLKKVNDLEDKALKERAKKYTQYLLKAQSERVKIKLEEIRQLNEIEKSNEYTAEQKTIIKTAIKGETQKKLDKEAWESFKNSDMYIQLFDDVEAASTQAIDRMLSKLSALKDGLGDSLDPSQMKDLISQIEKLQSIKIDRNPFLGLGESIKTLINQKKNLKEAEDEYTASLKKQNLLQDQYDNLTLLEQKQIDELSVIKQQNGEFSKEYALGSAILEQTRSQLQTVLNLLVAQKKITKEEAEQLADTKNKAKSAKEQLAEVAQWLQQGADAINQGGEMLQQMGVKMDAATTDALASTAEIASGIGDAVAGFASGNYLQAAIGVMKTMTAVFAIGDKKRERQIQKELKLIENLEKTYSDLENKISEAYSLSGLTESTNDANENLKEQYDAYTRMIAAEEAKKKTDTKRLEEWADAQKEILKQIEENNKTEFSIATGGAFDDLASLAQNVTDAWLEAFTNIGDGLSGLEDNFKETITSIVKQQASLLITNTFVEKWKKQLEAYIMPDNKLDLGEVEFFTRDVLADLPALSEQLEQFFTVMNHHGKDFLELGGSDLSGLQKGIQGVTEETAQIIEAYLNSMRFFVADSNSKLTLIANSVASFNAETNPIIGELKAQTEVIREINTLLNNVTAPHPTSGRGFKVVI